MNTIKIPEKGHTKIIAHRGLSGLETENTAAAYVAAGNRSYYGIESDTHITADGHFVMMHDAETGRVADRNLVIPQSTLSDLQNITLRDRDGSTDRKDLKIPLLKDYLTICKQYDKISVLELKDEFTAGQLEEIYRICSEFGRIDQTVFISFIYNNLKQVNNFHPKQKPQFLTRELNDGLLDRLQADQIDLDIHWKGLTADRIKRCHSVGVVVNCWTVNDREVAETLISYGIDFITTNILE